MERATVERLKGLLVAERTKLEGELSALGGHPHAENPANWEANAKDLNAPLADPNEVADRIEEFEASYSTEEALEVRLNEVKGALERMTLGTYGVCEKGGEPIEPERLEANPAARTCRAHLEG